MYWDAPDRVNIFIISPTFGLHKEYFLSYNSVGEIELPKSRNLINGFCRKHEYK